ncbi:hypothetical protein NIES2119_26215 [[Phormidium ambiguum] IAM M-71]|uniref:Uncharacterized protein n=1 Tax=[Phormidium ambiguum] IAM M-71 TaxID=454136 RepID=A0A1U7I7R6_9CYAN|nr:hypothetical protein [Phormidium ambiguum]OKH32476.1 hypothetical protein NIES2119_26215 [Phormidium ambiguum IAM M-71]
MRKDINLPMAAVVNDIEALITEIDENPQISTWVIRLVLKSIKDKAQKMALDNSANITNLNQTSHLEVLSNSATMTPVTITSFR